MRSAIRAISANRDDNNVHRCLTNTVNDETPKINTFVRLFLSKILLMYVLAY